MHAMVFQFVFSAQRSCTIADGCAGSPHAGPRLAGLNHAIIYPETFGGLVPGFFGVTDWFSG